MTSAPFINSQVSGLSLIQNMGSNLYPPTFCNKNYEEVSTPKTNGLLDMAPSQCTSNYSNFYSTDKHGHRSGTSNKTADGKSGSPFNLIDVSSEGYSNDCSSVQSSNCGLPAATTSNGNLFNKEKYQNHYSPQEFDSSQSSDTCRHIGVDWRDNGAWTRLRREQQTLLQSQEQCEDPKEQGRVVYTELQPFRLIPPNQVPSVATTQADFRQTTDQSNCQTFLGRFPQIKSEPHTPTAPSQFSHLGQYFNGAAQHIYSSSHQPGGVQQVSTGNQTGMTFPAKQKLSPVCHAGFLADARPPSYSDLLAASDRDLAHRNTKRLASRNTVPAWTARGRKNCTVSLYNGDMWAKFHTHTNEMIITKHGRRMFPVLHFTISNLDPDKLYEVFVSMTVADGSHWKFQAGKWMSCGSAEKLPGEGCTYHHPDSPNTGAHWMKQDVNFGKLKLTNNKGSKQKQIILNSMHRYQPRIHVTEHVTEHGQQGDELVSHAFVDTQFIAVTAYQNTDITDLKVKFNPYARGMQDKSRLGFQDSLNDESSKSSSVGQIVSPLARSISPSFNYGFSQNMQSGAHGSTVGLSPVAMSSLRYDYSHKSQVPQHFNKGTPHTYLSLSTNALSPESTSQHQNFLAAPPSHQVGARSDVPMAPVSSSSPQQRYLPYLHPPSASVSFLEHPNQSSPENQTRSEMFQKFLNPASFDIGHDSTYPGNGNTTGYPSSHYFPYIPSASMWSYPSPEASFMHQNLTSYNTTCVPAATATTAPGLPHEEAVQVEDTLDRRKDAPISSSHYPDFLSLSYGQSHNTRIPSTSTTPLGIVQHGCPLQTNPGKRAYSDKHDLHNFVQQSSPSPAPDCALQRSESHLFPTTWASDTSTASRHLSSQGFGPTFYPTCRSSSVVSDVRYFPYDTSAGYVSPLQRPKPEQDSSSALDKDDSPYPIYSPFDQGRLQKLPVHFLHSAYTGAAQETAAKEYDQLQREAAELSLDFMSRDVQLVPTKGQQAARPRTSLSSPDSPFVLRPVDDSSAPVTAEHTSLPGSVTRQGNDGDLSDAAVTSNTCQSSGLQHVNQTLFGDHLVDNNDLKHFHQQTDQNVMYSSSRHEKGQGHNYVSRKNNIRPKIEPYTSLTSVTDMAKVIPEKRKVANKTLPSKGPRSKKAKLTQDVLFT